MLQALGPGLCLSPQPVSQGLGMESVIERGKGVSLAVQCSEILLWARTRRLRGEDIFLALQDLTKSKLGRMGRGTEVGTVVGIWMSQGNEGGVVQALLLMAAACPGSKVPAL